MNKVFGILLHGLFVLAMVGTDSTRAGKLKIDDKESVFTRAAQRNANVLIETLGDRPISGYALSEGGKFRDTLLAKGFAVNSIKRMFGTIKAIINLATATHSIEGHNPFSHIYLSDEVQANL